MVLFSFGLGRWLDYAASVRGDGQRAAAGACKTLGRRAGEHPESCAVLKNPLTDDLQKLIFPL